MKKILLMSTSTFFLSIVFIGNVNAWSEKDEMHRQYIEQLDRQYEARKEYERRQEERRREEYERTYGGRDRLLKENQKGLDRIHREGGY